MARMTFKTLGLGLGAAVALGAAGAASALTLGPALDFLQLASPADPSPFYATAWAPPMAGVQQPALRGQVQITLAPGAAPAPVIGIGYLTSISGAFDSGTVTYTAIFGIAASSIAASYPANPWAPPPVPVNGSSLGWEPPCQAEPPEPEGCRPVKGYELFGASGTAYTAGPAQVFPLSGLPAALGSGFDLSPFAGRPTDVFYVFQTALPATELLSAVPEPGGAWLLAGGLAFLAGTAWRVRTSWGPSLA